MNYLWTICRRCDAPFIWVLSNAHLTASFPPTSKGRQSNWESFHIRWFLRLCSKCFSGWAVSDVACICLQQVHTTSYTSMYVTYSLSRAPSICHWRCVNLRAHAFVVTTWLRFDGYCSPILYVFQLLYIEIVIVVVNIVCACRYSISYSESGRIAACECAPLIPLQLPPVECITERDLHMYT